MTVTSYLIDSSVWLGYFLDDVQEAKEKINSSRALLCTSVVSLYEILKNLSRTNLNDSEINNIMDFIERTSLILDVNKKIAFNSFFNSQEYNLHGLDSLIYSTAEENNCIFVTSDSDFRNVPNTILLDCDLK